MTSLVGVGLPRARRAGTSDGRDEARQRRRRRPAGSRPRSTTDPGQQGAAQREHEADPDACRSRAARRRAGCRRRRRPSRPHGIPLNGQPLNQSSVSPRRRRPTAASSRCRCRTAATRAQGGEEERLPDREPDPGVRADGAHPEEQDELEAETEGQAGQPGRCAPAARGVLSTKPATRERDHDRAPPPARRRGPAPTPEARATRTARSSTTYEDYPVARCREPRKGPAPFGPARSPTGCRGRGCCLGDAGPFRVRSRGADRPPRTRSDGWLALHPPTRPLGRRSACHDLHERTAQHWIRDEAGCQPLRDLRKHAKLQVSGVTWRHENRGKILRPIGVSRATRRAVQPVSQGRRRCRWRWWRGSARRAPRRHRAARPSRRRARRRARRTP